MKPCGSRTKPADPSNGRITEVAPARPRRCYLVQITDVLSSTRPVRRFRGSLLAPTVLGHENPRQAGFNPVRKPPDLFSSLATKRCQLVFHVGRDHFEGDPVHQAVTLQPLQGLREHPFADTANGAPQLTETVDAGFQHQQNQNAPPAGDVFEHLARRTGFDEKFSAAHSVEQAGFVVRRCSCPGFNACGFNTCGVNTYFHVRTYKKFASILDSGHPSVNPQESA